MQINNIFKYASLFNKLSSSDKRRKPINKSVELYHITDLSSAKSILSDGFFTAQPTYKGFGVCFSANRESAKGLLNTLKRMFTFWGGYDSIDDYFIENGSDPNRLKIEREKFIQRFPEETDFSVKRYYITLMSSQHPAVGGPASGIPNNEFLWADIGKNLAQKEGPIVAIECDWDIFFEDQIPPSFSASSIEAEVFLNEKDLEFVTPRKILEKL